MSRTSGKSCHAYRFDRWGLNGRFRRSTSLLPDPDGEYDVMIYFELFEQVPDPLAAAERPVKALRVDGLFVQLVGFWDEGYDPCQLREGIARCRGPGLAHSSGRSRTEPRCRTDLQQDLRLGASRAKKPLWPLACDWTLVEFGGYVARKDISGSCCLTGIGHPVTFFPDCSFS
jgi:hypothetical protein